METKPTTFTVSQTGVVATVWNQLGQSRQVTTCSAFEYQGKDYNSNGDMIAMIRIGNNGALLPLDKLASATALDRALLNLGIDVMDKQLAHHYLYELVFGRVPHER